VAIDNGVEYIFSGRPIAFFNVAIPVERGISADRLKSHGNAASAWAASQGVPWLLVVTHEALEAGTNADAVLDGCGMAPLMPLTGMIAQQVSANTRLPDGLQLTVPRDDVGCAAILDVNGVEKKYLAGH
jgi:hypothetical protein